MKHIRRAVAAVVTAAAVVAAAAVGAGAEEPKELTLSDPAHSVGYAEVDLDQIEWIGNQYGEWSETNPRPPELDDLEAYLIEQGRLAAPGADEERDSSSATAGGESAEFGMSPLAGLVSCTSWQHYRILYSQPFSDTTQSQCFAGAPGTVDVFADADLAIGHCPGVYRGQAQYHTYSGLHWTTVRGPVAQYQCYYFDGVYPDRWSRVRIITSPYS